MVHPNGSFSTQWRRASLATLRRENVQLKREQQIHYGKKKERKQKQKKKTEAHTPSSEREYIVCSEKRQ